MIHDPYYFYLRLQIKVCKLTLLLELIEAYISHTSVFLQTPPLIIIRGMIACQVQELLNQTVTDIKYGRQNVLHPIINLLVAVSRKQHGVRTTYSQHSPRLFMYATTKDMKKTKRAGLGSIHAAGKIKMASRLANRLKSLSPYVDEKVFRNLQKRLENIPLSERRSQKIQASKGRFFCDLPTEFHGRSRSSHARLETQPACRERVQKILQIEWSVSQNFNPMGLVANSNPLFSQLVRAFDVLYVFGSGLFVKGHLQ